MTEVLRHGYSRGTTISFETTIIPLIRVEQILKIHDSGLKTIKSSNKEGDESLSDQTIVVESISREQVSHVLTERTVMTTERVVV